MNLLLREMEFIFCKLVIARNLLVKCLGFNIEKDDVQGGCWVFVFHFVLFVLL